MQLGTLADLIAQVRDNVCDRDPTTQRWTDTTIISFLNDAQVRLAQLSKAPSAWTVTIPAGSSYITKPPELLVPKKAYFELGDKAYRLDVKQGMPVEPATVTGYPDTLYILGSLLHIRPVPNQTGVINVEGIGRPTPMANLDDVPALEDADSALIAYATWMCLMADGDPAAAGWKQVYEQARQEWAVLDAQKYPLPKRVEREWWVEDE